MPISVACALIALAVCGLAILPTLAVKHHPSALVHMAIDEPLAESTHQADPSFVFNTRYAHYDGVYFYAIARDPLARGTAHDLIDHGSYRYGHAGFGLVVAALTLTNVRLIPWMLMFLGIASAAGAAAVASKLAQRFGWTPWAGLFIALNPGIVFAVTADTSEAFCALMLGLLLLAWLNKRPWLIAIFSIALCMTKETFLLVAVGIGVWEIYRYLRGTRSEDLVLRLIALSTGPLVFAIWFLYVSSRFGISPFADATDVLQLPLSGWASSMITGAGMSFGSDDAIQIGQAEVPLLAATGGLFLIGLWRSIRLRSILDPIFLLMALVVACYGPLALVFPKDLFRLLAIPAVFLAAVLINPRRDPALGAEP